MLIERKIRFGWSVALLTAVAASGVGAQVRKPPVKPGTPAPPATAPATAPAATDAAVDPLTARAAIRLNNPTRRVLALYYPWYGTPQKSGKWLHQDGVEAEKKSIATHAHYPALGAYDSTDPAVIDKHLDQAKSVGIDTLVCSWWGRQDATDKALRALVTAAAGKGMTVCVMWEKLPGNRDAEAATADLNYLMETFGKQAGYLREGDRPVVFALAPVCSALSADQWAAVLGNVAATSAPGVRIIGEGAAQADVLLWDGLQSLGFLGRMSERSPTVCARIQAETYRVPILLGRAAGRISVVTLSPGCDERKANTRAGAKTSLVIEREDGGLYRALWDQAIRDSPDWVLINSFNQWHAGTEIEPSAEFGEQYLTLTRDFATRFKKSGPPVRK